MKNKIIISLLLFTLSCKYKDDEIGKSENYILTERPILEDCKVFQMRFQDGECIFKFSLAGPCKNINIQNYLQEYSRYLHIYHDSLINRRGYITLDYYGINDSTVLQDSVLNITKRNFKTFISISRIDENSLTMKVFDKR